MALRATRCGPRRVPTTISRPSNPTWRRPSNSAGKLADCFPGYEHIADPLIDFSDYGMKASSVRQVFADLRAELVPLVEAILEKEEDG